MKALYWVIGVVVIALGIFISILLGDANKSTTPIIKLTAYSSAEAFAAEIVNQIKLTAAGTKSCWIGFEPDKKEQVEFAQALKTELENKNGAFDEVIADSELQLPETILKQFKVSQVVFLKDNVSDIVDALTLLEKQNKKYLLITASVYSTSLIKKNPANKLIELMKTEPLSISFGYYASTVEAEKNILFPCSTEDKSGTSDWGCAVLNKGRNTRRKFQSVATLPWVGLLDLVNPNDYMALVFKQD